MLRSQEFALAIGRHTCARPYYIPFSYEPSRGAASPNASRALLNLCLSLLREQSHLVSRGEAISSLSIFGARRERPCSFISGQEGARARTQKE